MPQNRQTFHSEFLFKGAGEGKNLPISLLKTSPQELYINGKDNAPEVCNIYDFSSLFEDIVGVDSDIFRIGFFPSGDFDVTNNGWDNNTIGFALYYETDIGRAVGDFDYGVTEIMNSGFFATWSLNNYQQISMYDTPNGQVANSQTIYPDGVTFLQRLRAQGGEGSTIKNIKLLAYNTAGGNILSGSVDTPVPPADGSLYIGIDQLA